MRKYIIVTDSCGDLSKELRKEYNIEYVPMHMSYDGKDMVASLDFEEISVIDFYNMMREGTRFITSQVSAFDFRSYFEKYINEGYDVLYVSCSSALSSSIKTSYVVRDELLKKYPNSKIICVDSLNSSQGLGLICKIASRLRGEGKTIEEVANWLENNKLKVNQECTVEKLTYLKRAGRVSAASAFFGGILNVKPIIISDVRGNNAAIEKVKGRKVSYERLVERMMEEYEPGDYKDIVIAHADCMEDALEVKKLIISKLPDAEQYISIEYIGPIVGASAGPGTLAIFFVGKEVTFDSTKA